MIRYFCDTCKKDITNERRFNCKILYETKSICRTRGIPNEKRLVFCEECNNKMIEKIEKNFLETT